MHAELDRDVLDAQQRWPRLASVASLTSSPALRAASLAARATATKSSSAESTRIFPDGPFAVSCIHPPVRSPRVE